MDNINLSWSCIKTIQAIHRWCWSNHKHEKLCHGGKNWWPLHDIIVKVSICCPWRCGEDSPYFVPWKCSSWVRLFNKWTDSWDKYERAVSGGSANWVLLSNPALALILLPCAYHNQQKGTRVIYGYSHSLKQKLCITDIIYAQEMNAINTVEPLYNGHFFAARYRGVR